MACAASCRMRLDEPSVTRRAIRCGSSIEASTRARWSGLPQRAATDSIAVVCRAEAHRAAKSIDPESMSCATRSCATRPMYEDSGRAASSLKPASFRKGVPSGSLAIAAARRASSPAPNAIAAIRSDDPSSSAATRVSRVGGGCGTLRKKCINGFVKSMNRIEKDASFSETILKLYRCYRRARGISIVAEAISRPGRLPG